MIYITKNDKKRIDTYCKAKVRNGEKIHIKTLGIMLDDRYSCNEVITYIKNDLGIDLKYIFHGEADYIVKLPRGHVQLTNMDIYYPNIYLHQYVIHKELNVEIDEVQKYIIHHIDQNKGNNDISNLWIFYNQAVHQAYHQAIKHNPNIDIKQFTMDYVEGIINKDNSKQIKDYLDMLDKLQKAKNKKCLSTPIDKHSKN